MDYSHMRLRRGKIGTLNFQCRAVRIEKRKNYFEYKKNAIEYYLCKFIGLITIPTECRYLRLNLEIIVSKYICRVNNISTMSSRNQNHERMFPRELLVHRRVTSLVWNESLTTGAGKAKTSEPHSSTRNAGEINTSKSHGHILIYTSEEGANTTDPHCLTLIYTSPREVNTSRRTVSFLLRTGA